jgi:Peptidase M10 serralysin C terminal
MTGGTGSGSDTFVFSSVADSAPGAADTIVDFVDSSDRIDMSAIDANTSTAATDSFILVENTTPGTNPGVQANSITWYPDAANGETIVQADVNGDTTADLVIVLTGLHSLNASFIL